MQLIYIFTTCTLIDSMTKLIKCPIIIMKANSSDTQMFIYKNTMYPKYKTIIDMHNDNSLTSHKLFMKIIYLIGLVYNKYSFFHKSTLHIFRNPHFIFF